MNTTVDIVVVGGGFSGAVFAAALLRRPRAKVASIAIVEPAPRLGRGVAYALDHPSLLLNGRASTLSAVADDPDHFVRWARARDPSFDAEGFAPRGLYGEYVEALLDAAEEETRSTSTVVRMNAIATRLRVDHDRVRLELTGGRVEARTAVLAIGSLKKPFCLEGRELAGARFFDDPWSFLTTPIDPGADVLVLGTRLTMIDVAASLFERGHRGTVHALSRRGLVSRVQRDGGVAYATPTSLADWPRSARGLLRAIRAEVALAAARGIDWRDVLGSLRSETPALWRALPRRERERFLRHLLPFWEIHRHRAAPATGKSIDAMTAAGRLVVHSGRLVGYEEDATGVRVAIQPRRRAERHTLRVDHVVDATGRTIDVRRPRDPFVRALVDDHVVCVDPLGLGFVPNPEVVARVRVLGPMQLGEFWEHTAVPELAREARDLAVGLSE